MEECPHTPKCRAELWRQPPRLQLRAAQATVDMRQEGRVWCPIDGCPVSCLRHKKMINHIRHKHPNATREFKQFAGKPMEKMTVKGNGNDYNCPFCGFAAWWIDGLIKHVAAKHPEEEEALAHYESERTLLRSKSTRQPPSQGALFCEVEKCEKRYVNKSKLYQHVKNKHPDRTNVLEKVKKEGIENIEGKGVMKEAGIIQVAILGVSECYYFWAWNMLSRTVEYAEPCCNQVRALPQAKLEIACI